MSNTDLQSRGLHLLSLAKTIRHYEEALIKATGERFNLFDILHVGHYEVRTHSPMLAELLNPRGAHGQGSIFLQNLLVQLEIQDFDAESAQVETEVLIGALGRIDIVLKDENGRSIFIENKIYAGLQENQLGRYHEHDPKAKLLFLTLNNEAPSDWTSNPVYKTESFNLVFQSISYRADIVRWLEACRKEAATAPGVREAITQYIHLIQRLTQQNTSARMNQEIIKAVTHDSSTFLAYANLCNAAPAIRQALVVRLNAQLETIGQKLGLISAQTFVGKGEKYEGYFFTTPALKARNLMFGFECQGLDYRDFCFGFSYIDSNLGSSLKGEIARLFPVAFGVFASSKQWPACPAWNEHRNWDDETMAAIVSGEFAKDLKVLIGKLADVATQAGAT